MGIGFELRVEKRFASLRMRLSLKERRMKCPKPTRLHQEMGDTGHPGAVVRAETWNDMLGLADEFTHLELQANT
jgi:hypothetical protein